MGRTDESGRIANDLFCPRYIPTTPRKELVREKLREKQRAYLHERYDPVVGRTVTDDSEPASKVRLAT